MKHLNQELYDQLGGSISHILNYAYENNTPLLDHDKLYELTDRVENNIDDINILTPLTTSRHQHKINNILNTQMIQQNPNI